MASTTVERPALVTRPSRKVALGEAKRRETGAQAEALGAAPSAKQLDQRQAAMGARRRPGPELPPATVVAEALDEAPRLKVPPTDCRPAEDE